MKKSTVIINFKERDDSQADCRCFDGWLSGDPDDVDKFPTLSQRFAMSSRQAIEWKNAVENRAWKYSNAPKIDRKGNPVEAEIETEINNIDFKF
jgi:hypothetical protein